ncbi:MAG: aminotransferase class V-fold PLP-dependent enzyme [Bacteroidota bacterium]
MSQAFSAAEIEAFRQQTEGTQHVVHLNNAGAALPPDRVRDRVLKYLREEALYGAYELSARHAPDLQQTYQHTARFLNAEREEIALVENATIAWNLAFSSLPLQKGDVVLTTKTEYGSNFINYLKAKEEKGIEIELIPTDAEGSVDLAALEAQLRPAVRLLAITHIPTNSGLVQPAEAIGDIAERHGLWYLLDSCQSIGQLPMDVKKLKCSILTATGRKYLRGPRGTGFLYVQKKRLDQLSPPYLDQHSANWLDTDAYEIHPGAQRFENWESNKALRLGLSESIAYAMEVGMDRSWQRIQLLAQYTRTQLAEVPGIQVLDLGKQKCGIVSFRYQDHDPVRVQQYLLERGINTSVSDRPFTLIDMDQRGMRSVNRASVHYYNTEAEIDRLAEALTGLRKERS